MTSEDKIVHRFGYKTPGEYYTYIPNMCYYPNARLIIDMFDRPWGESLYLYVYVNHQITEEDAYED